METGSTLHLLVGTMAVILKDHYKLFPTDKLLEANGITTATAGWRGEGVYRTYATVKFNINGKVYEVLDIDKEE